jgi:hypothetical protein
MGVPAMRYFGITESMEHAHGKPVEKDGRIVLPAYHPAAALRDTAKLRQCQEDFQVLRGLVKGRDWREYHVVDEYPNPKYVVVDTPDKVKMMEYLIGQAGEFAVDTEICRGRLWSVQISCKEGEAYFIPIKDDQQGRVDLSHLKATVIVHNYLFDIQYLKLSETTFVDSMTQAYLLGQPQGLKELASRLCGIQMVEYREMVKPGQQKLSLAYLQKASKQEWPDPPTIDETKWDNKKGCLTTKSKRPWHISRKITKMLDDYATDDNTDLWDRWRNIPEEERAVVEGVIGAMPESSLADIPREQAIDYACLSQDSRVRMADGTLQSIRRLVQTRSTEPVLSWDGKDIVARPIVGWHRVVQKEHIEWFTIVARHSKPQLGGINHDGLPGTRYTPDHRVLTQRGMIPVCELTPHRDKVALPYKRFSDVQRQVLLGSTLGDGYLANRNSGGWPSLRIGHTHKQLDYLKWKVSLLGSLCCSPIRQYVAHKSLPQGGHVDSIVCESATIAHPEIWDLWQDAYRPDKQIYDYVDDIGALGLAIFYMDDGTIVGGCTPRISAHSFSMSSLYKLRDVLLRKWGIVSHTLVTSSERSDQFELFIDAPTDNFWKVIATYIPDCMQHKLPKRWQGYFRDVVDDEVAGLFFSDVLNVVSHPTPAGRRGSRKTAWCIDVAETHNFFTIGEVVHNCRDSDATLRVYHRLKTMITDSELDFIQYLDLGVLPQVNEMMQNGMPVDVPYLNDLSAYYFGNMEVAAELASAKVGHPFNPSSSKQVAEVVYGELGFKPTKKTATGLISTDDQELKKVKHPVIADILEYRRNLKNKSTFADALVENAVPHPHNGGVVYRVHTTLKTTRTETGRLSSADPINLQTMPTRSEDGKKIRKGFKASQS